MKNYLKYLLTKPLKIAWLLAIYTLAILILYNANTNVDLKNESDFITYAINIFVIIVVLVASYQPYKEYKDGISK